jgi:hypothetical protein
MDTSDTIAKYQDYAPSRLGPRWATVILATNLAVRMTFHSQNSRMLAVPWHDSRKKASNFIRRLCSYYADKDLSFASSKVSAVVLTSPVMENDDCTSYCRLLQLDLLQKNNLP